MKVRGKIPENFDSCLEVTTKGSLYLLLKILRFLQYYVKIIPNLLSNDTFSINV